MEKTNTPRRVVITGYGCITPLGNSANESWDSIMNYKIGYNFLNPAPENSSINARFFGRTNVGNTEFKKIPAQYRRALPRFAKVAFLAAQEALQQAFNNSEINQFYSEMDCGAIVGTGWGGLDEAYDCHDQYNETGYGSPLGSLLTMPNIATAVCSMMWNLRGYQNTPIAACATGTIAIGDAFEAIKQGRAKMMLAGGSEALNSKTNIWNIDILQALSKETNDITKASCPFDANRSGFVLSEGAAIVCLEELESALARKATILGEITGYGSYSDARDFTAPAEDKRARIFSITKALDQAKIAASDIDYINAHGTSTPLNDLNETETIKDVFGKKAYEIPISSTKSYSGHLISAAGSFETILCLKVIENGIIPATINLNNPDPQCDLDYVPNKHREMSINTTLNLSFGFGGANAALVIEKFIS